jgi:hypothetical protein
MSLSPTIKGYFIPLPFFGIYGRFSYAQFFNFTGSAVHFWGTEAGASLRGVPDNKVHASQMFTLNLEFPLGIPRFTPSRWVKKGNKYFKPFDLEFQFSPFVDMALLHGDEKIGDDVYGEVSFGDFFAAAGFEVFAYSLSWRSLYLRASIGWDLREWYKTGEIPKPEFFFGMERFF